MWHPLRSVLLVVLFATPLALFAAQQALAQGAQPELVTLPTLLDLKRAGVGDDLLIMMVEKAKKVEFDTSTQGVIAMKQAGISDTVIKAIIDRQTGDILTPPGSQPTQPQANVAPQGRQAGERLAGGANVSLIQNGKNIQVFPSATQLRFVKSNAADWDTAKSFGALTGLYTTVGALATTGAGAAAGTLGLAAMGLGSLSRTRSEKGFVVQYLLGDHASTVLVAGLAFEFRVALASFNDGKYAYAKADLVRVDPDSGLKCRVVATAKGAIKYKLSNPDSMRYNLDPYVYKIAGVAEVKKEGGVVIIKSGGLTSGEYAIAFVFEKEILPHIFDCMVHQPDANPTPVPAKK